MRRRAMIVLAVAAMTTALAGCSSVDASLDQSLTSAVAAVVTAQRATELQLDGRATLPYLATVYGDALTELQVAENSAASVDATPGEAVHRGEVLATIRRAVDAVITAQEDLNSGSGLRPDDAALTSAAAALKAMSK